MKPALRLWGLLVVAAVTVHGQSPADSRRQTLDELLRVLQPSRPPATGRINAQDRTWEEWLRRTGELPPDFDALPSIPDLPDPLLLRVEPIRTLDAVHLATAELLGEPPQLVTIVTRDVRVRDNAEALGHAVE